MTGTFQAESGNPGGMTDGDLAEAQTAMRRLTVGVAGLMTAAALAQAQGFQGYEAAAQGMLEAPYVALNDPAAGVAMYREIYQQALTAISEGTPAETGSLPGLPLMVLPFTDFLSVKQGTELQIPLLASGGEGPVTFQVAGLPAGVESRMAPLTDDGRVQQLDLRLSTVAPGTYPVEIHAFTEDTADQAAVQLILNVRPAAAPAANRAPVAAGAAAAELRLDEGAIEAIRAAGVPLIMATELLEVEIPAEALAGPAADEEVHLAVGPASEAESALALAALAEAGAEPLPSATAWTFTATTPGDGTGENAMAARPLVFASPVTISLQVAEPPDPGRTTAALVAEGQLRTAPTRFEGDRLVWGTEQTGTFTIVTRESQFSDTLGHWADSDIRLLANKLIVNGVGGGRFAPGRLVSRAEAAAIVARGLGLSLRETDAFRDVPAAAWFNGEVGAAVRAGLVNGYADGSFQPHRSINRTEAAVILVRALNKARDEALTTDEQIVAAFVDSANVPDWAAPYVAAAVELGILGGYEDGTLRPENEVTRAELVVMVRRALEAAGVIEG